MMQFSRPGNSTVLSNSGPATRPVSDPPLSDDEFDALLALCVGLTFFDAGSSPTCELKRLAELGLMELGSDGTLQPTRGRQRAVRATSGVCVP